ncbi:hypothetical protein A0H81_11390 [Grifola frondosa]|uniref:Uncharacterized protein n=1 Tax=Grifola frondosa TaxID=5627 RepID=A0A1C7LXD3_GRIFR|nr:hypothetical protein A0H81_11390 [Grifola frondosa]
MDNSTNNSTSPSLSDILPSSLDLPAHLSAQKYFFVCTLTVAAWDTLVLTPRTWRIVRTREWPLLKILFFVLRVWMPVEFAIAGVAFFDTKWSLEQCSHFWLFEPICTAMMLAICSLVHVIRIYAIYQKNRTILHTMGGLLAFQVVITAICCGFYRMTPLLDGQGCIAEPKASWVGIYWLSATLLYTVSFVLALNRSFRSLKVKPLGLWKLILRDGLNLYTSVWAVNMVNLFFWFIITPTGPEDPVRTIVTSHGRSPHRLDDDAHHPRRTRLARQRRLLPTERPLHLAHLALRRHDARALRGARPPANPVLSLNASTGAAAFPVPLAGAKQDWDDKSGSVREIDGKDGMLDGKDAIDIFRSRTRRARRTSACTSPSTRRRTLTTGSATRRSERAPRGGGENGH